MQNVQSGGARGQELKTAALSGKMKMKIFKSKCTLISYFQHDRALICSDGPRIFEF